MLWTLICALPFLFLLLRAAATPKSEDGDLTIVKTAQGAVRGSYNASSGVYRYLGIPYGADTSGSNRFMAPKPARRRKGTLDATTFAPACPQLIDQGAHADMLLTNNRVPDAGGQSEDCLRLNIWVSNATMRAAREVGEVCRRGAPVLLFIHGGSYVWGASSSPVLDANRFVQKQEDLIVITFDYRLNIFGFPRAPQLKTSSGGWNVAFLDRDLAISWVRENVGAFGGDPNRITLWGQSSGGASADLWAFSHAHGEAGSEDVAGLIIESGAATSLQPFIALSTLPASQNPLPVWNDIAAEVGCGSKKKAPATASQRAKQLKCLQRVPWRKLLNTTAKRGSIFTAQADNRTAFDDLQARSAAGRLAKVPTLIGSNTHEATTLGGAQTKAKPAVTDALITDLCFTCGASAEAADRAKHGIAAFRYSYDGNWDDINSGRTELKAFHGSELSLLFGTYGPSPIGNWGNVTVGARTVAVPPAEDAVAAYLQKAWAAFARDPQRGLPALGWPKYDPKRATLARIAVDNSPVVKFDVPEVLGKRCSGGPM